VAAPRKVAKAEEFAEIAPALFRVIWFGFRVRV
jgi:hypothetical protein